MKEQKNLKKFHLRNDVIFIVILLLICAVAAMYLFVFRSGGDTVRVNVDGEIYGVFSLSENIVEDIRSKKDASGVNRLVIKDGKAYVESASCPDGVCVAHRPVFRNGESIVCLPNGVVITVITDNGENSPDIVA